MGGAGEIEVRDVPERERYEVELDGTPAGFTAYVLRPGLIAFTHTEVDQRLAGHGLASRLIGYALDDARARSLSVLPFCPFVRGYIERHPAYLDLVPAEHRSRFGLPPVAPRG